MNAVEIENGKIVGTTDCTGEFVLPDNYKTISKAMYDSIGAIPCSFTEVAGEITSIEYIEPLPEPTPEPAELELLQEDSASLWYESMIQSTRVEANETEVASLWYELMMGGM